VNRNTVTVAITSFLLAAMPALTFAAQQSPPDNTRVNQRDRSANQPMADQGKNNRSDRDIMKDIRKSVVDDKSLSTYAHNVKIISQNGKVTLKGVCRSDEERRSVRLKAEQVAGAGNVRDNLSVRPKTN
jgi:hyperosmotically inducible periplasmic protein